jgi:hypothetical protein
MGKQSRIHRPVQEAHPRHVLAPSRPSTPFLAFARAVAPFYLRFALKFQDIRLHNPVLLIQAFRQFQNKETRLLFAFRHPYGDEPQLLQHAFDQLVPRLAKKAGSPLPRRPHVRFIHGYDVAFWGGAFIRFVLPRAGAVPIQHLQADPAGMKQIRELLLNDTCPLALAPEGQISYRSASVPRLEPGTARIGFWCARDLDKAGRGEQALILPISVHYQYREQDAKKLQRFISKLEAFCGLSPELSQAASDMLQTATDNRHAATDQSQAATRAPQSYRHALRARLIRLENALIAHAERHYGLTPNADYEASRAAVIEAALQTGERMLGLQKPQEKPTESGQADSPTSEEILNARITRVYRIRKAGWDRIYPIDVPQPDGESPETHPQPPQTASGAPLPQAMRHRDAGEGWYAMRHMELVDILEYLDAAYLDAEGDPDGPPFDRLCETAINLQDLACRMAGGNITTRANPLKKRAVILTGNPINLNERLPAYQQNMKQAVREVTETLREEYLQLIHSWNRRRNG